MLSCRVLTAQSLKHRYSEERNLETYFLLRVKIIVMSRGLEQLHMCDDDQVLFYACPLPPEDLEPVLIDGELVPGIRPAIPQTYDFETGLFVPQGSEPVICAGTDITVVAFHGLVRAAAIHVPPYARRNGWDTDTDGTVKRVRATQALNDYIQERGTELRAYVYRLCRTTPPFHPFDLDGQATATEWRSKVAVSWLGDPVEIDGTNWPAHIVDIVEPYQWVQYGERDSSGRVYRVTA